MNKVHIKKGKIFPLRIEEDVLINYKKLCENNSLTVSKRIRNLINDDIKLMEKNEKK